MLLDRWEGLVERSIHEIKCFLHLWASQFSVFVHCKTFQLKNVKGKPQYMLHMMYTNLVAFLAEHNNLMWLPNADILYCKLYIPTHEICISFADFRLCLHWLFVVLLHCSRLNSLLKEKKCRRELLIICQRHCSPRKTQYNLKNHRRIQSKEATFL